MAWVSLAMTWLGSIRRKVRNRLAFDPPPNTEPSLMLRRSTSSSDEGLQIRLRDPDGVQDANVRELSVGAERVNGRHAHPELPRGSSDREQNILDPSWTQRFVFLRCGMGDS